MLEELNEIDPTRAAVDKDLVEKTASPSTSINSLFSGCFNCSSTAAVCGSGFASCASIACRANLAAGRFINSAHALLLATSSTCSRLRSITCRWRRRRVSAGRILCTAFTPSTPSARPGATSARTRGEGGQRCQLFSWCESSPYPLYQKAVGVPSLEQRMISSLLKRRCTIKHRQLRAEKPAHGNSAPSGLPERLSIALHR